MTRSSIRTVQRVRTLPAFRRTSPRRIRRHGQNEHGTAVVEPGTGRCRGDTERKAIVLPDGIHSYRNTATSVTGSARPSVCCSRWLSVPKRPAVSGDRPGGSRELVVRRLRFVLAHPSSLHDPKPPIDRGGRKRAQKGLDHFVEIRWRRVSRQPQHGDPAVPIGGKWSGLAKSRSKLTRQRCSSIAACRTSSSGEPRNPSSTTVWACAQQRGTSRPSARRGSRRA